MNNPDAACVVLTTTPSREEARKLAGTLLENQLAACVQMLPIDSVYRWKGAIQSDAEILLLIKTRCELYAALEALIRKEHSYDVPEIVQLRAEAVSDSYLGWITSVTASA